MKRSFFPDIYFFPCQRWQITRSFIFYVPKLEDIFHSSFASTVNSPHGMERTSVITSCFLIIPVYYENTTGGFSQHDIPWTQAHINLLFQSKLSWNLF